MSKEEFSLPETVLKVVKADTAFSIFLLEGERLIFFPA